MFGGRATKTYTINNPHYAINIDVEIAALRTPGPDVILSLDKLYYCKK